MKFNITQSKTLEIVLEDADREAIQDLVEKYPHDGLFLQELLVEYTRWSGNGQLFYVGADEIGAITDAPIITDEVNYPDDGDREVTGNVWWYPAYERYHFGEELLKHGRVFFTFASTETIRNQEAATLAATH